MRGREPVEEISMFFRPVQAACAVAAAFALPVMPAFSQTTALETMVVTAARQVQRASEVLVDFSVIDAQALRAAGPSATVADVLANSKLKTLNWQLTLMRLPN